MRKIPYTDIEIYKDPRVPVMKKILSGIIGKVDFRETIVTIMPDNNAIALCKLTTVFCLNLKECIPGYKIIIDPRTFSDEFVEQFKLEEDEYVSFNQASSGLYLNIDDTNMKYFYNISNYNLIDQIEGLTDYEVFQNEYLTLKADDGSKFFRGFNNKFLVPVYTKFPNIAKSDVASLYVYKLDFESDLVVWKVFKKKLNRDVYTIFRVMSFQ